MYTTVKGNTVTLTPALWAGIKRAAWKRFDGTQGLFDSCWRQYRGYVKSATDDPKCLDDVTGWLDSIASEKVNSPRSRFYIYG